MFVNVNVSKFKDTVHRRSCERAVCVSVCALVCVSVVRGGTVK